MKNTKGRGGRRLNREEGLTNFFPLKKGVGFLEGGGFFERWVGGLICGICFFNMIVAFIVKNTVLFKSETPGEITLLGPLQHFFYSSQ